MFRLRRAARIEEQPKRHDIKLFHDTGSDILLPGVSEKNLKFICNNLGRDVIYVQDKITVNLGKFSIAMVDPEPDNNTGAE